MAGRLSLRGWALSLSTALCLVVPGLVSSEAQAAPPSGTGSISGIVVDGGGSPLAGICVNLENGPGTQTDDSGGFSIIDLAAGSYWLQFVDCQASPTYVTQWYAGQTDRSSATSIDVADGIDTPLGGTTMQPGVSIIGTVTDGAGNPLGGMNVWVNPTNGPGVSTGAQTAPDGTYVTSPVPSGDYRVQFSDPSSTFATQYWNQQYSWGSAQALQVSVANGPIASGVDAMLAAAATISGTVTDGDGQPLEGICVSANVLRDGGTDNVGQTTTIVDGTFTLPGLPPADLRVQYHDCNPTQHYLDQWYGGANDANSSPAIVVVPAEQRSGVDAQLQGGISVSGTVTDSGGAPISGINVNVNPTASGPSGWAQTGPDGTYLTGPLPLGDYRVQFSTPGPAPAWATQFWHQQPSWNTADILTITADDAPIHAGIDAVLSAAATISGTVTGPQGQPVGGICVNAIINTANGLDGLANTTTAPDGTYALTGLSPMDVEVLFDDCNHVGPYARQAWQGSRTLNDATPIIVTAGAIINHIDAQLVAAGSITGTVRNDNHLPLAGICVQATTDTFVGGLTSTDNNGNYSLVLDRPGDYHVQFVDCSPTPTYAGKWWTAPPSSDRGTVTVAPGAVASGIDADLTAGAVATIRGTVRNAQGVPMTSACVVAYLPNQFAIFASVETDGTYSLHNVPSGTYALAFLGCDHGEPGPTVTDPTDPTTTYAAVWWRNVPLTLDAGPDGGPDPIAQGALLVTVAPGANLTGFDHCFGCLPPITITSVTTDGDSITVAFSTTEERHAESFAVEIAPTVYTLTCSSPTGVTRSASAASSPITVTGVTAGATYTCIVTSTDGATTATSASFSVEVPSVSVQPATIREPTIAPTPPAADVPVAAAATLPRTGLDPRSTLYFALALLILGFAARACRHDLTLDRARDHRDASGRSSALLRGVGSEEFDHAEVPALRIGENRESPWRNVGRTHLHLAAQLGASRGRRIGIVDREVHHPMVRDLCGPVLADRQQSGNPAAAGNLKLVVVTVTESQPLTVKSGRGLVEGK